MEADPGLVAVSHAEGFFNPILLLITLSRFQTFTTLQGKSSVMTRPCTGDCIAAKICYMRSGSVSIGSQCPQGYGSVQS